MEILLIFENPFCFMAWFPEFIVLNILLYAPWKNWIEFPKMIIIGVTAVFKQFPLQYTTNSRYWVNGVAPLREYNKARSTFFNMSSDFSGLHTFKLNWTSNICMIHRGMRVFVLVITYFIERQSPKNSSQKQKLQQCQISENILR